MVSRNNREVLVLRMADTWNTNVHRLVEYLKAAFPGTGGKTGLNDYYSRTGTWPTIEQAIRDNQRVFISRLKVQKLRDQSEASVRSGYGLGTHWVRSYMAWDIMGVYA